MKSLRELRAAHPARFHANQSWFDREAFMDIRPVDPLPSMPPRGEWFPRNWRGLPADWKGLPTAATLAALYLKFPNDPVWQGYLWCSDVDARRQHVYVGAPGGRFEIHRHLHLTGLWRLPVFERATRQAGKKAA